MSAPTYVQLAKLVAELTEINIANLDGNSKSPNRFVCCFTHGTRIPPHWRRAIETREALIANKVIRRKARRI